MQTLAAELHGLLHGLLTQVVKTTGACVKAVELMWWILVLIFVKYPAYIIYLAHVLAAIAM
jgi:hypothetical protein